MFPALGKSTTSTVAAVNERGHRIARAMRNATPPSTSSTANENPAIFPMSPTEAALQKDR
jgi:hypothetical protein